MPNRSTAILGFVAGKFDMTWPYQRHAAAGEGHRRQAPKAICELATNNGTTNLLINRDKPPFDNPDLRQALALTLDRKAFIDIMTEGKGKIGGAMLPPPEGLWGMPAEMLQTLPGYGPDVAEEPGRGARDHGEARLRAGQAAGDQGLDPQRRRPSATRR